MEIGADLSKLYYRSLVRRTFVEAKYWGAGLSSLQRADGIVWATLTLADRKASGYTGKDDADLINIVSSIDDADIAIMFVEQNANTTKISWRGLKPQWTFRRFPFNLVVAVIKPPRVRNCPAAWPKYRSVSWQQRAKY